MATFCCPSGANRPRGAFTLVELLVTITIITMLAGLVLGGLTMARTAAREMKTKSTIAKIDEVMMRMYAGYAHRRVPIDTSMMNRNEAALSRNRMLLDIIRMEMPDRHDTGRSDVNLEKGPLSEIAPPALSMAYKAYMPAAFDNDSAGGDATAVCLYMIVNIAHPRELEHFGPDEIGVVNGLPVFVDAWGNPIRFLRWAPGFPDSDIQESGIFAAADIADPRLLLPLIYSAGRDGQYGIHHATAWPDTGEPDGTGAHYDNIHNHRLDIR